jgi:hypothetical protein
MRSVATLTMGTMLICASGCAGSADDLCALATAHIEDCTGVSAPAQQAGACSEEAAETVLSTSCEDLQDGTRTPTFFGNLFNWLFGGGGSKSSGGFGGLPEPGGSPQPEDKPGYTSYSPFCSTSHGVCRLVTAQPIGTLCKCSTGTGRIIL